MTGTATPTDPLVAFLRARLDEDETAAMAAAHTDGKYGGRGHWSAPGHGIVVDADDPGWAVLDFSPFADAIEVCAHLVRHDPASVLRDVEADRKLIRLHSLEPGQHPDFCGHDMHKLPCPTLRIRAERFSDHPDYRPEWKP